MTAPSCPRLFEAEAMRDGRLAGAERASFERHVATCPACAREVAALEGLADALRASHRCAPDELHVRRERTRLLAAFDRALVTPGRRAHRWLAPSAIGAVVAAACVGLWSVRRVEPHPVAAPAEVRVEGDTVWSSRMVGALQRIVLERGELWIHVDHSRSRGRLVVVLPDGELEDTGTTFAVRADDDHTTRVAVEDGRVILRLQGRPPVTLGPGQTWVPDLLAPVACASTAPPPAPAPSAHLTPTEASAAPRRPPAPLASAPASVPTASPAADDSAAEFRGAMDALDQGDNQKAASLLATFLTAHPRDARAEDAAYLRAIALQRSGDVAGARDAAREYLRRHPAGFRHVEMESMSR